MRLLCGIPAGCLLAALPLVSSLKAQQTAVTSTAEMTTKDAPITFKSGVNLVPVPVVVRDAKGHAIGNLSIEDFQLFDNGKPQLISKFSLEKLASGPSPTPVAPVPPDRANDANLPIAGETLVDAQSDGIPDRFVAYLFDDLHMSVSDLHYTRDAAARQIDSSAHALQRAAIYTTSGQVMQEFTGDKAKLHAALAAMGTGHATSTKSQQQSSCPPMTHYMGDLIYNKNDANALNIAVADAIRCANLTPQQRDLAVRLSQTAARDAVLVGERDSELSLAALRAIVSKLASMPGQRTLVLVSPGFLVLDDRRDEQTRLIERAIRANVVIGALDARGLYGPPGMPDASVPNVNPNTIAQKSIFMTTESTVQADVMGTLADGTGGTFYHGTNDYDQGIARTAAAPEYLYVLGFSPLDLKLDGKYHSLKVTLKTVKGMDLQVRKGYYAPKYAANPAEQAKQQIEETFFSRDEVHDLPATLQTQYFKGADGDATLSAVAKIDVKKLAFRKEAGRNRDDLTVVTGLFDNDGNYVSGAQKLIEMRLLDDTLEKRVGSGIAVKNSFTVHPGRYVVRMVVRDSEGQLMSAQSSLVDIP
jgi:VWFA-related protein